MSLYRNLRFYIIILTWDTNRKLTNANLYLSVLEKSTFEYSDRTSEFENLKL